MLLALMLLSDPVCKPGSSLKNCFYFQVKFNNQEVYVPCNESHPDYERTIKSVTDIPNHLLRVQFDRADFMKALAGRKSSVKKNDKQKVENIEKELC